MSDITIPSVAPEAAQPGITQEALDAALAEAEAAHQERLNPASEDAPDAPAKAEKPSWVEDKFWDAEKGEVNAEAMAKSYAELQKKLSNPAAEEADEAPAAADDTAPVAKALAAAGLSFEAIDAEYQASGEVSPDTMAKLVANFGQSVVDNYFSGLKAQEANLSAAYNDAVYGAVGGQEQYGAMVQWAAANASPEQIAEFNAAVNSGDQMKASLAAKVMYGSFTENGGKAPNLVNGGKTATAAEQGYASIEQMGKDLNSAQYREDPAFRRQVDAKVEVSTVLMRR